MLTEPIIKHYDEQPYMAIRTKLAMKDIPAVLPPQIKEVFDWLGKRKLAYAGPPFFRYLSCDSDNQLVVEVGVPVSTTVAGDDHVLAGAFPAGDYAKITHIGPFSHLKEAHMQLESWAKKNGVEWKQRSLGNGVEWGCRIEYYPTDPKQEPNPEKWQADILFLIAG